MKSYIPMSIVRFLLVLMIVITSGGQPGPLTAQALSCGTTGLPQVLTDKHEYDRGETVSITGSGFDCDVPLTVRVTWPLEAGQQHSATVITGAQGEFSFDYLLDMTAVSGAYTVDVLDANGGVLASVVFYDSHFRFGQITWNRVEDLPDGKIRVQLRITLGFRRSYPFNCQNANIGAVCNFGLDGRLAFGDGTFVTPSYTVIGIDAANDWLLGTAVISHDYPGPGVYTASNASCCRISPPRHINNPDGSWRVASILNLNEMPDPPSPITIKKRGSPSSLLPAIVDCPRNTLCRFEIMASDPDSGPFKVNSNPTASLQDCKPGDLCYINFRLAATPAEWGATYQPGPLPGSPGIVPAKITTTSCTGWPCGIFEWDTTGARVNIGGDTFYSTQVIIEELDHDSTATNRVVIDSTAVDFLIRIVNGPASGDANQMIRVPVRACGVEGAPSIGATAGAAANNILRGRIARVSSIYRPQTQITFFGGTTTSLPDFPVIPDPDTTDGQQGDIVALSLEWLTAINNCRLQWQAAPQVTGMTLLHLNDFIREPMGLNVAGIALIPSINSLTSQTLLGVATSIDNRYTLQSEVYGDSIGDNDDMCEPNEDCRDSTETIGDEIEVLDNTIASGNKDGVCNTGETCRSIGDDDGVCEVGEACATEVSAANGGNGNGDGFCNAGERCDKGDKFDSILGHEIGHALTLWHGNGYDNDGNFLDGVDRDNDGFPDGEEITTFSTEPLEGPNLMQYVVRGTLLTSYQRERLRAQVLSSIPDRLVVTPPNPAPLANMWVDALGDTNEPFLDIDAIAATVNQTNQTTGLGITVGGLLPDNISGLTYTFLVDSDNNPATGGNPGALPGLAGTSTQGIEWVGQVEVATVNGAPQTIPTVYVYNGTQFSTVSDSSILARVERPHVEGLPLDPQEPPVELPAIIDSIQLQLGNQVRGSLANDFVVYVLAQNANTGGQDEAWAPIKFHLPQFPGCTASPASAFVGSSVTVQATGFLPNSMLSTLVGVQPTGSGGSANASGNATLSVPIPIDATAGLNAISVEDQNSGLNAVCALQLEAVPEFISPPTPSGSVLQVRAGQPITFQVKASDRDVKDTVRLSMIGEPLTLGAVFTATPGNPANGVFDWTPSGNQEGRSFVLVAIATDQKGLASAPLTIVIEVTGENVDTTPPIFTLPSSVTLEATSGVGAIYTYIATATDETDPAPIVTCQPASGSAFALGATTVTCTATDATGNQSTGSFVVTVLDTTAPTLTLSVTPGQLWPPNHKLVPVNVAATIADAVDSAPIVRLLSVTSDEPDNAPGNGDGNTTGDIVIVSDFFIKLRAERAGDGDGRVYTLTYQATDASGNTTTAIVTVIVPHNQGQ